MRRGPSLQNFTKCFKIRTKVFNVSCKISPLQTFNRIMLKPCPVTFFELRAYFLQEPNEGGCFRRGLTRPWVKGIPSAWVDIKHFCSSSNTEFITLQCYYIQINQITNKPEVNKSTISMLSIWFPQKTVLMILEGILNFTFYSLEEDWRRKRQCSPHIWSLLKMMIANYSVIQQRPP